MIETKCPTTLRHSDMLGDYCMLWFVVDTWEFNKLLFRDKIMFNRIQDFAFKKGYALARKKGMNCPSCSNKLDLPAQMPEGGLDAAVSCQKCGWEGLITDLFSSGSDRRQRIVTEKPLKSKIKRGIGPDGETWEIPAEMRPNFMWLFSLFWLGITGVISAAFIVGFIKGGVKNESGETVSGLWLLFFVPFWIVGLGTLYAAFRGTFGYFTIIKNRQSLKVRRHLLGNKTDKELLLTDVEKIILDTAYSQNEKPVYEVKIVGKDGNNLKFGAMLTDDEKSWMVYELSRACKLKNSLQRTSINNLAAPSLQNSGLEELSEKKLKITRTGRGDEFKVEVKDGMALWLLLPGIVVSVIGAILLYEGVGDLKQLEMTGGIFGIVEAIFSVGGFVAGCVMSLVGLVLIIVGVRLWGSEKTFEFGETELIFSKGKGGKVSKTMNYQRSSFTSARMKNSGHVNESPRYEIRLLGKKPLRICQFIPEESAHELEKWLNHWAKSTIKTPQQEMGYGGTLKI